MLRVGAREVALGDVINGGRGYAGWIPPPTDRDARVPNHLEGSGGAGPMVWRIRTGRGMILRGRMGSAMRQAGRGRTVKHRMKHGLLAYDAVAAVAAEKPGTARTTRCE